MRHQVKGNHLGRTASHRRAMLANMAISLIIHKAIRTTLPKARELRMYVEPLITKSKEDTTHSRRTVFATLGDKEGVKILFRDVAPKVMDRPGGYTRILKLGNRQGDGAEVALIELVDFNEYLEGGSLTKSTRRKKKGTPKKADAKGAAKKGAKAEVEEVVATPVAEAPAVEAVAEVVAETPAANAVAEVVAEEAVSEVAAETPVLEAPVAEAVVEAADETHHVASVTAEPSTEEATPEAPKTDEEAKA
jgi:large subunit ribosomal protein L17